MSSYLTLPSGRPNPYAPQQQQAQQPVNPWGSLDPSQQLKTPMTGTVDQAYQGLNYAAQKGWGKTLSDQDKQRLAQASGYTSGAVNQDHYNKALTELGVMYGAQTPPGQPPPPTGGVDPKTLGPESAINQWKMQAPAAGVPASFRGTNPYAQQQQQIMGRILQQPQTMSQQWQDQQNEGQKESAQRMMAQAQGQGQQALAGRGFGSGGGTQQALQANGQQQMMQQILAGRRDTAQKAAQVNRQDEYNALDQSGKMAQQDWDNDMTLGKLSLDQQNQNRQSSLQEFLGQHGADMDMLNHEQGRNEFNKTYGLDFLRYLAQKEQFGQTLGENQRQHNNQQGFNWASLSAQQQQQLMNTIIGAF